MNWNDRLTRAEKRGMFTPMDERLGLSFATCAVGEHKALLALQPRSENSSGGLPFDPVLVDLGCDFYWAVLKNRVATARTLHNRIQRRVAKLPAKYRAVPA
jgi:hypothetical protein